mgnify:CR=1 FL=1
MTDTANAPERIQMVEKYAGEARQIMRARQAAEKRMNL